MTPPKFSEDPYGWFIYWIHWIMATFGMGLQSALEFWFKVNPSTGMTPYQTTAYLQNGYDQYEKQTQAENAAKTQVQFKNQQAKASPAGSTVEERDARMDTYVEEQQAEFNALSQEQQAAVMKSQDEIEAQQRYDLNQKMLLADQIKKANQTSSQPAPSPTAPTPVNDTIGADLSPVAQHQATQGVYLRSADQL